MGGVVAGLIAAFVAGGGTGATWTSRTLPSASNWYGVNYGNGLFWVGSQGTAIVTSPDGITWTARTGPATGNWSSAVYGNGTWVAVSVWQYGAANNIATSTDDGATFTQRTTPGNYQQYDITFDGTNFVIVHLNSTVAATSPDGITWTARTLPSSQGWARMGSGNGYIVVTQDAGGGTAVNNAARSTDHGVTWGAITLPYADRWADVCYGAGKFVAVARGTAGRGGYSTDNGATWTGFSLPSTQTWYDVTYGNGFFVAAALNDVATSPDGITWTQRTVASGNAVGYGANTFVMVSYGSATYYTSL